MDFNCADGVSFCASSTGDDLHCWQVWCFNICLCEDIPRNSEMYAVFLPSVHFHSSKLPLQVRRVTWSPSFVTVVLACSDTPVRIGRQVVNKGMARPIETRVNNENKTIAMEINVSRQRRGSEDDVGVHVVSLMMLSYLRDSFEPVYYTTDKNKKARLKAACSPILRAIHRQQWAQSR